MIKKINPNDTSYAFDIYLICWYTLDRYDIHIYNINIQNDKLSNIFKLMATNDPLDNILVFCRFLFLFFVIQKIDVFDNRSRFSFSNFKKHFSKVKTWETKI